MSVSDEPSPRASPGRLRSLHRPGRRAISPARRCGKPRFTSGDADPSPGQSSARRPWPGFAVCGKSRLRVSCSGWAGSGQGVVSVPGGVEQFPRSWQ